ncbi:unnamed protein product, partial [Discosporangium mesarthrocarpum]
MRWRAMDWASRLTTRCTASLTVFSSVFPMPLRIPILTTISTSWNPLLVRCPLTAKMHSQHLRCATPKPPLQEIQRVARAPSPEWRSSHHLLLVVAGGRGSKPGVWSRSACLSLGLGMGSMIPFLATAGREGYGVIVTNPVNNFVVRYEGEKVPIDGSSTPEQYLLSVWHQLVGKSAAQEVFVMCYGPASRFVKVLIEAQCKGLLSDSPSPAPPATGFQTAYSHNRDASGTSKDRRISAVACVEALKVADTRLDSAQVREYLCTRAINWQACLWYSDGEKALKLASEKAGCPCLPVPGDVSKAGGWGAGIRTGGREGGAISVSLATDAIFRYFRLAAHRQPRRIRSSSWSSSADWEGIVGEVAVGEAGVVGQEAAPAIRFSVLEREAHNKRTGLRAGAGGSSREMGIEATRQVVGSENKLSTAVAAAAVVQQHGSSKSTTNFSTKYSSSKIPGADTFREPSLLWATLKARFASLAWQARAARAEHPPPSTPSPAPPPVEEELAAETAVVDMCLKANVFP